MSSVFRILHFEVLAAVAVVVAAMWLVAVIVAAVHGTPEPSLGQKKSPSVVRYIIVLRNKFQIKIYV